MRDGFVNEEYFHPLKLLVFCVLDRDAAGLRNTLRNISIPLWDALGELIDGLKLELLKQG